MSNIEMKVTSQGVDKATRDYDKLSKAEKKAFEQAVKLDKQMKKTGSSAKSSGKGAALGWKQVAAGVGIANVGMKAFQFIQGQIIQEFNNLVNRQKEGLDISRQWTTALGGLQQNFKNLGPDPEALNKILKQFEEFSLSEGKKGGANAIELLRGTTALSSAAGAASVDVIDLVRESNRAKILNPEVSIETQGVALLSILDELRKINKNATVKDASNVSGLFGSGAGGSVDILAGKLAQLSGSIGTGGKGSFTQADLFSLFGQQTAAFKDTTGEQSLTAVTTLAGKLPEIEFELKRQGFTALRGERAIERLIDLAKRFKTGEFEGTEKGIKVTRRIGLAARRAGVLNKIAEGENKILSGSSLLTQGSSGGADILGQTLDQRSNLQKQSEAVKAAQNSLLAKRITDEATSGRGAAAEIVRVKRLEAGKEGFFGGALKDPTRGLRSLLARGGRISPEQQIAREQEAAESTGLGFFAGTADLVKLYIDALNNQIAQQKKTVEGNDALMSEIKRLSIAISGGTKSKETVEPGE